MTPLWAAMYAEMHLFESNSTVRDHDSWDLPIPVGFPFCLYINWANPTLTFRLLGWSAFAGFMVLLAGWPLNSFIA